jgi:hypothetical protein
MNLQAIAKTTSNLLKLRNAEKNPMYPWVYWCSTYNKLVFNNADNCDNKRFAEIRQKAITAAVEAGQSVYDLHIPALFASLEAELKGEICPQPEPDPDAYLQPLTAAFGPHKGLNADWAVMSWLVVGNLVDGVWITDDENDETVSLITRKDDGSGDPALVTICQGTVDQVLPIALSIIQQVQHG